MENQRESALLPALACAFVLALALLSAYSTAYLFVGDRDTELLSTGKVYAVAITYQKPWQVAFFRPARDAEQRVRGVRVTGDTRQVFSFFFGSTR